MDEIEETLESLSENEIINEVIPWLVENSYIKKFDISNGYHDSFDIICKKLIGNKHLLTKKEEELITKISNTLC